MELLDLIGMDFFIACTSRVRGDETSTLFQSLDDEDKAASVSLTYVQTHYRARLSFFSKCFEKAVKTNSPFSSTFSETSHELCPDTVAMPNSA